jgi:catechol 2,3-dioxygenase-like lactoylglutathione lyase family enzyme
VNASIDHLVIAADSLEQGADWRAATFGVQPSGRGKHPLMGTHHRVIAISSESTRLLDKTPEEVAMTVTFNHTIVYATDKRRSAEFLANVLGLPKPQAMWSFMTVPLDHGVALDFATADRPISPQHYAFLVSEEDFDGIFTRIQTQGIPYWADPGRSRPQQINHNDGGRGVYFADPDGHFLEAITRPYGSGAA